MTTNTEALLREAAQKALSKLRSAQICHPNAVQSLIDEAIDALALQPSPANGGEPVAWRNVIPGGRKTNEWESTRIADYNLGWNDYRKAAKTALEHLETSTQPLPSAWMYTLEYGGTIADTKVSLRQLNYPFGVCGADYLRENSDGISYVRQTPLYTHPAAQGVPATTEPFGYFRAEPFGWHDCAPTDEGAIPLYEHPAQGVPDDVFRVAIATVRERYRGTQWGKAAESICDAIDAAIAAAQKGGAA